MIKPIKTIEGGISQAELTSQFHQSLACFVESFPKPEVSERGSQSELKTLLGSGEFEQLLLSLLRLDVYSEGFSEFHADEHWLDAISPLRRLRTILSMTLGVAFTELAIVIQTIDENKGRLWMDFAHQLAKSDSSECQVAQFLKTTSKAESYNRLFDSLEVDQPHSIYPTSAYRESAGHVVSSKNDHRVEAVMTSKTYTSIKVTENVLEVGSTDLSEIYSPLNRCVALVDTNVEEHFGKQLEAYFEHHDIPLVKLIYRAMEVDKGIQTVERMLGDFKQLGVSRNEPVLIVGGGVLCDTGGLACALFHRNTPYIMLSTSIVAGIDAGPSPRTCCDGFGYKNLFGSYHAPVLSITDRTFFSTLEKGWVRHGISEVIKMATVKDIGLFELLEEAGPALVDTKFGNENCEKGSRITQLSQQIVASSMRSYVEAEYDNLYETHQCRPHAYGHTWSPGFEIPAGLLHGHAISIGMGFGAFLSWREKWIKQEEMRRILNLIASFDLSLWHPILDNEEILWAAQEKMVQKRGGNLAAPLPKGKIGRCGYLNELSRDNLFAAIQAYKQFCKDFPREGLGIEPLCKDVGLEDPATVAESNLVNV